MRVRLPSLAVVVTVVAVACTRQPLPGIVTTTTTTAGLPSTTSTTSTTVTLPPPEDSEQADVVGVLDGDSLVVRIDGEEAEVRLLGVNAPERGECWADAARTLLTDLVTGARLTLVADEDVGDRDDFDRLLRYAYLDAEEPVLVNEVLVREGAAVAVQSGHRLQDAFKALEDRAWASGRGLWGTFACETPRDGVPDRPQLQVDDISYDPPGDDAEALGEEWVRFVNESYTTISLTRWTLRDESSTNRLTLPRVGLRPGSTLTVITGCGSDDDERVYWCAEGPVWSNGGDTVILQDPYGNVVERYVYTPER